VRPAGFDQPRDSTMNGHGGKRPGAGRPRGAASRANEQMRQEAAATGELPLAYMLRIMRDPSQPAGRRESVEHSGEISRPTVIRAPAVSATLEEWQAEYAPGAQGAALMADGETAATAYTIGWEPQPGPQTALRSTDVSSKPERWTAS
jgi:hypothetical protein